VSILIKRMEALLVMERHFYWNTTTRLPMTKPHFFPRIPSSTN
jgi:hypothetical protein